MNNKSQWISANYILLGIFSLGAIIVFGMQAFIPVSQTNQREVILYSAFEVGLSIGIGWIIQDIYSRKQFRQELKQFAFSAYRRIIDIRKAEIRLKIEVNRIRSTYSYDKAHELDALRITTDVIGDIVTSSIADWADVIGEELDKSKEIKQLEEELHNTQLALSVRSINTKAKDGVDTETLEEMKNSIKEMQARLDRLRSELPSSLQYSDPSELSSYELLLKEELSQHLQRDGHIPIVALVSSSNEEVMMEFQVGNQVTLYEDHAMGGWDGLIIVSRDGVAGSVMGDPLIDTKSYLRALVACLRQNKCMDETGKVIGTVVRNYPPGNLQLEIPLDQKR